MVSVPLHLGNCITYALLVSICKVWDKTCQSIYRNLVIIDDKDPVFFRVFLYPVIFVSICICICNCAVLSQLSEVCMWRAGNLQREIGPTQLQHPPSPSLGSISISRILLQFGLVPYSTILICLRRNLQFQLSLVICHQRRFVLITFLETCQLASAQVTMQF